MKTLFALLHDDKEQDPYLRHAAVFAMARIGDVPALLAGAKDQSASVRMGALLALRRLQRPEVAQFLNDADPQVALEAARAIYDAPIPEAMSALADVPPPSRRVGASEPGGTPRALVRRILNANFRLGGAEHAQRLAQFAASDAPEPLRVEALELLALWPKPPGRDHVVGLWRPLPARDGGVAAAALQPWLAQIKSRAPAPVKLALAKTTSALGLESTEGTTAPSGSEKLRQLAANLERGSITEKQTALAALAVMEDAGAAKLLGEWLDKLIAGSVAKELQLDVLEAVANSRLVTSGATKDKLAKFEAARDAKDALAKWRECLHGGNAEEGKKTFIERQDAACFRCHKINGEGGEIGPEMAGLGARHPREYILESILFPNKTIATGFESVLVNLKNGTSYAGMLKSETDAEMIINSPEDGLLTVKKTDVKSRDRGLSAMPEEQGNILSKSDIRNLIEFLSTLK